MTPGDKAIAALLGAQRGIVVVDRVSDIARLPDWAARMPLFVEAMQQNEIPQNRSLTRSYRGATRIKRQAAALAYNGGSHGHDDEG